MSNPPKKSTKNQKISNFKIFRNFKISDFSFFVLFCWWCSNCARTSSQKGLCWGKNSTRNAGTLLGRLGEFYSFFNNYLVSFYRFPTHVIISKGCFNRQIILRGIREKCETIWKKEFPWKGGLISWMLKINPWDRLNAEQLLEHPFIKKCDFFKN